MKNNFLLDEEQVHVRILIKYQRQLAHTQV